MDKYAKIIIRCHPELSMDLENNLIVIALSNNYINIDRTINLGFLDAYISYLSPHDFLKLLSVSKYLRERLCNKSFKIIFNLEILIVDIMTCSCNKCKYNLDIDDIYLFKSVCKKLLKSKCDINTKISLVNFAYEHNLVKYLSFLNESHKLNILSVNVASKFNSGYIYTEKLSLGEILQLIIDTSAINTKVSLIRSIDIDAVLQNYNNKIEQIVEWIIIYHENNGKELYLISQMMKFKNLDTKFKIQLVPYTHKYYVNSWYDLKFLDETTELNKLSIKYARNNIFPMIFTSKLSDEEYLQAIYNSPKYVKFYLIEEINLDIKMNEYPELSKLIIDWLVVNIDKLYKDVVSKIMRLTYCNSTLKVALVPKAYELNCDSGDLVFLKENAELNELSIIMGLKHSVPKWIYYSHLSTETSLKYIAKSDKHKIRRILLDQINVEHVSLKYDMDYNNYDLQISHNKYKLKIDNKVFNVEHAKLLVEIDSNSYFKIFDRVLDYMENNLFYFKLLEHILDYLINHEKFSKIYPSKIIKLQQREVREYISDMVIEKHDFFKKFV